jgi:hypothetical protein
MADIMPSPTVPVGYDPQFEGAEGLIAPGQEELAQQLLNEGEPVAEPQGDTELIGGKFKTNEDLLRAYQELERKQSQSPSDSADTTLQPDGYTAEQAVEIYGDEIVNAVNEAGLNMAELMWTADSGGDISEHYDALSAAIGVPRQVVENYVSKAQAGDVSDGMSSADEAQIIGEIGGQEAFQQLSGWAKENLEPAELADYNAVVDSGNKSAIRWALKAMQARSGAGAASSSEPRLIRGQAPAAEPRRFNSKSEVLEAMNKRDSRGRKLYEVDTEYQRKFAELLENSDVF